MILNGRGGYAQMENPRIDTSKDNAGFVSAERLPYRSPALVEYGSVSKLTQGGAGSGTDGGSAGMTMQCL
jgi:hypothetical protein